MSTAGSRARPHPPEGPAEPPASGSPPAVEFTEDEAAAVAVALVAMSDGPLADAARAALHKVLTALGPAGQERVVERAAQVWTRPDGLPRSAATPVIEDAMRGGVAVTIDYVDAAGRPSHRRVEPHAFAYARGSWYLLAWSLDKDAPRWFRWDRIGHAELTDIPIQWREAFATFPAPSPRS
ncbi:WYL domain-containing protein [Frankia sp. AgB1.9]|uniref:helix-turn-helix transcriptional regulator n=1 Tax=unclassified Frankia TaxID=2632575 RepID=UPI001931DF48|nr:MULTISPECIES: WYL domain-containing protein [unclassified Frankia]MBL7490626.1 WYL domain-containing protein [Frankia sp. AgW1.1]MBL7552056.1 WYL domain-containing protein [Frankia sp. AgB1.9]MBL7620034.1 WYL domain-containing protein [Frankia sp. AgB1.8]